MWFASFINGLKKFAKKTIFSSVPGVPKKIREASAHKSVRQGKSYRWGIRLYFDTNKKQ
jgi:hypothetical protein